MICPSCACRWICPTTAAAKLIDFLRELTEALERHYAGQLLRYAHRYEPEATPDPQDNPDERPF